MATLNSSQRSALESVIIKARKLAEIGARNALNAMAVDQAEPFTHLSAEQRELRRRLRNRARLLGDTLEGKVQQIDHLSYELAYEYWHKMLFAKFLESNGLLMHPQHGISVSLDDCEELAKEENYADKWTAAAHYASRMLPAIFRTDDPLMQLDFSTEDRIALENLIVSIDQSIFIADDSLGWVYQFWQSEAKDRINKSGDKIDGEKLPAVTQLFTEPYMVHFLIDNTIGAWWVSRHPNEEPPVKFEYLRFSPLLSGEVGRGMCAAGQFEGWPASTSALTMLDPCMGSGHFAVATFEVLVKLRMYEENLFAADATKKVIAENIFGLELDSRCTQIAAFNLALAAWKFIGKYEVLPEMNLACSGIAPRGKKDDWIKLAGKDVRMQNGMAALYDLFQQAPELGSLLDPSTIKADLETASFAELQTVLEKALEKELELKNDEQAERGVMALGINSAAKILVRKYSLILTNVPYLGQNRHSDTLSKYCLRNFKYSKADLATVFLERCVNLLQSENTCALVTPQNWLFLGTYKKLRSNLLTKSTFNFISRLGPKGFRTIMWDFNVMLIIISKIKPFENHLYANIDVAQFNKPEEKDFNIKIQPIEISKQLAQLSNPDNRITSSSNNESENILLSKYTYSAQGIGTTDNPQFLQLFWEQDKKEKGWVYFQTAATSDKYISGYNSIFCWEGADQKYFAHIKKLKAVNRIGGGWQAGSIAWGFKGFGVNVTSRKIVTFYSGEKFDTTVGIIIVKEDKDLLPVYTFLSSPKYTEELLKIDQGLSVTEGTLVKVPFDLEHWKKVAEEKYLNGLPEPYSNDPTQWIFKGDIPTSENPLHVAVARLLGYHWPDQPADEILDAIEDDDGIVCIPSVNGEPASADRLRMFLKAAYSAEWSNHTIEELLKQTGVSTTSLETWLRESFFEQHFKLFHHRPFIWHIWDGRKDGFGVLVNYHKLSKEKLQKIIFTYLGDWLRQCEAKVRNNESGSEGLLLAAKELKKKLELILLGEPPYDIFVRWKFPHQQPIGWEPDINDGVRLNIRPFMEANILRKKPNIKWEKDRGKNSPGSPWGEDRINDRHLTLTEKRESRETFEQEQKDIQKEKT